MRLISPTSGRSHSPPYSLVKSGLSGPRNLFGAFYTLYHSLRQAAIKVYFHLFPICTVSSIVIEHQGNLQLSAEIPIYHNKPLSMFALNPFCRRVLSITHQAFAVNVTFGFIACVFIWILVSFRRRDWVNIAGRGWTHPK